MSASSPLIDGLLGCNVVIDMSSMFVHVGRLIDSDALFLTLEDADVHDLRDTSTSRERYVVDSKLHGVRSNRRRVHIRWDQVVSLSALDDVLV